MTELVRVVPADRGGVPVREIRGELDASNVTVVLPLVLEGLAADAPGLVLDLTQATYLDSAGVRVLFELARRLEVRGQALRVVAAGSRVVSSVVDMVSLGEVAAIDETVDDAVAALAPPAD